MKIERTTVYSTLAETNKKMWLNNRIDFVKYMEENDETLVLTKYVYEDISCMGAKSRELLLGVLKTKQFLT